ncbi:unnamed protein product [Leptidea sinapis]|uniref:Uncharacterized protein n=1 Tax=Leptidea sinapis TaxID=189913 RepID=A0A5E4Q8M3_9NEOP|nr:unnamed protein product [Leptidea sinapis]
MAVRRADCGRPERYSAPRCASRPAPRAFSRTHPSALLKQDMVKTKIGSSIACNSVNRKISKRSVQIVHPPGLRH